MSGIDLFEKRVNGTFDDVERFRGIISLIRSEGGEAGAIFRFRFFFIIIVIIIILRFRSELITSGTVLEEAKKEALGDQIEATETVGVDQVENNSSLENAGAR